MKSINPRSWRDMLVRFVIFFGIFTSIHALIRLHAAGQPVRGILFFNLLVATVISFLYPLLRDVE